MLEKLLPILFISVISCENTSRVIDDDKFLKIEFRRTLPGSENYFVPDKTQLTVSLRSSLWKGEVPYEIADIENNGTIILGMDIYHKYTCIRFKPKTDLDLDYLHISGNTSYCVTTTSKNSTSIRLGPSCLRLPGVALHELMHAFGFVHEHVRPDRDEYIIIHEENIEKRHLSQFKKLIEYNTYGVPYDFNSVLHYPKIAFTCNKNITIEVKPEYKSLATTMGQRQGFSKGDITKINEKFSCPEKTNELNLQTDYLYGAEPIKILSNNEHEDIIEQ